MWASGKSNRWEICTINKFSHKPNRTWTSTLWGMDILGNPHAHLYVLCVLCIKLPPTTRDRKQRSDLFRTGKWQNNDWTVRQGAQWIEWRVYSERHTSHGLILYVQLRCWWWLWMGARESGHANEWSRLAFWWLVTWPGVGGRYWEVGIYEERG